MKRIFTFLWAIGLLNGFFINVAFGQRQATLVKDIWQGKEGSGIKEICAIGNKVLFGADDNSGHGNELWISDGTETGTFMLKDINKGVNSSSPQYFRQYNNIVTFQVYDSGFAKIYRTDGTEKGTFQIWDRPYSLSSVAGYGYGNGTSTFFYPNSLPSEIVVDSTIYWLTDYPAGRIALIQKDFNGSSVKTILDQSMVNDTLTGTNYSAISAFASRLGNKWLVSGQNINKFNPEYWVYISDGTAKGTQRLFLSEPSNINNYIKYGFFNSVKAETPLGLCAFFCYGLGGQGELWKTDGTISGTKLVKSISGVGYGGRLQARTVKNGIVFMVSGSKEFGLWFSDGTDIGTKKIDTLPETVASYMIFQDYLSENPVKEKYDNLPFFSFTNKDGFNEIWRTDGTNSGTKLISNDQSILSSKNSSSVIKVGNNLYFTAFYDAFSVAGIRKLDLVTNLVSIVGGIQNPIYNGDSNQKLITIAGNNAFFVDYSGQGSDLGLELFKLPLCPQIVKINTPNGTSFCTGSSVIINGEATGTTNPFTYKWKQGTSDVSTATNLTVNKVGTYTLEVTDKGGCTVSTSVDITQTANLPVNISGINSFCVGQNTTLTATPTGGVAPITYQWKQGSANVGTNANTLVATSVGSYSVGITDKNGCTGTSTVYSVTQKPTPNVTITKSGTTDLLTGSSVVLSVPIVSGQTYQWSKSGVTISGATNNSYTVNGAGSYTVTVIGNGCSAISEAVITNLVTAIEEAPNSSEIQVEVSPNPTQEICRVKIDLLKPSKVSLQLLDMAGRTLQEQTLSNPSKHHETTLDFSKYADGVYLLQVSIEGKSVVKKVVRQN